MQWFGTCESRQQHSILHYHHQEYHDHILPRSLCKYLYNIYHPCDVVSYRVEPIFMKFYSQVEPVHLKPPVAGATFQTSHIDDAPLQPLQNARKEDDHEESASGGLPVNIANGSINISMGKMLNNVGAAGASMSPSISMPKIPSGLPGLGAASTSSSLSGTTTSSFSTAASGLTSAIPGSSMLTNGAGAVGDTVNQGGLGMMVS